MLKRTARNGFMLHVVPCLLLVGASTSTAAPPKLPAVTAPPKELGLDPFYAKYLSATACPSSAHRRSRTSLCVRRPTWPTSMLDHRPEVRDAMIRNKVRLAVMAYSERTTDIPEHRDLQPKPYWNIRAGVWEPAASGRPSVARGEPAQLSGRPVLDGEHPDPRIRPRDPPDGPADGRPDVPPRLRKVYEDAKAKGLWKGTYAISNISEYWAEGVQSWFDTNRQNDSSHNHVDTRDELKSYDPALAKLVEEVFGDGPWRYVRPDKRTDLAESHLAGYEPGKGPRFQWEPELLEARRKNSANVDRSKPKAAAPPENGTKGAGNDDQAVPASDPCKCSFARFAGAVNRYQRLIASIDVLNEVSVMPAREERSHAAVTHLCYFAWSSPSASCLAS